MVSGRQEDRGQDENPRACDALVLAHVAKAEVRALIVLCFGGRDFSDERYVRHVLSWFIQSIGHITQVVEGDARGADRLCGRVAQSMGITVLKFRADWDGLGKRAGPIRNQQMLDEGKPDAAIGFPGGVGTRDMTRRLIAAKIPILIDAGCLNGVLTTTNSLYSVTSGQTE